MFMPTDPFPRRRVPAIHSGMSKGPLTIWCNAAFPERVMDYLARELGDHNLVLPPLLQASNLVAGGTDPLLASADVAFGQPDPRQVVSLGNLKWVPLTTAGYTRYDRDDLRQALRQRGGILTNSSWVYEEPCAEELLAFMLALARELPQMVVEQMRERSWKQSHHRQRSRLMTGQTAILYGYGTIAKRLTQLLAPLQMN